MQALQNPRLKKPKTIKQNNLNGAPTTLLTCLDDTAAPSPSRRPVGSRCVKGFERFGSFDLRSLPTPCKTYRPYRNIQLTKTASLRAESDYELPSREGSPGSWAQAYSAVFCLCLPFAKPEDVRVHGVRSPSHPLLGQRSTRDAHRSPNRPKPQRM